METNTLGTNKLTVRGIINRTITLLSENIQLALTSFVVLTGLALMSELLPDDIGIGLSFASAAATVYFQTVSTKSALSKMALTSTETSSGGSYIAVLMVSIIAGLGMMAGLLVFVIPAFILAARWSVSVPVIVMSDQGISAALAKSWDLTKPHTLAIMGALLIILLPLIVSFGFITLDEVNSAGQVQNIAVTTVLQLAISFSTVAGWYVAVAIFEQVGGTSETLSEIFA